MTLKILGWIGVFTICMIIHVVAGYMIDSKGVLQIIGKSVLFIGGFFIYPLATQLRRIR